MKVGERSWQFKARQVICVFIGHRRRTAPPDFDGRVVGTICTRCGKLLSEAVRGED